MFFPPVSFFNHVAIQIPMVEINDGLLYSDTHMWILKEGKNVRTGLTDFGQTDLGEVVFVDIPKVGSGVKRGDEIGALESVKTVESLFAPVSGKIVASNTDLSGAPGKVNASPYADGWIAVIEMTDENELKGLMDADAYKRFCIK